MKKLVLWVLCIGFVSTSTSFLVHPPRRINLRRDTTHIALVVETHLSRFYKKQKQDMPRFALEKDSRADSTPISVAQDYVSLLRPITLLQAVGAWIVGRLVVLRGSSAGLSFFLSTNPNPLSEVWAIVAVYLSYGVGMVANDCADALVDCQDVDGSTKNKRAIASGRISGKQGWIFVAVLSSISLLIAFRGVSTQFGVWCTSNLVLMLMYALGLQNLLLVKNIVVGWLCISPLWGATTLATAQAATAAATAESTLKLKMARLAFTGFSMGVIREVLKDIEDVDLDRGTKSTLPLAIGAQSARRLSFLALGITIAILQSPPYRSLFSSSLPLYSIGWFLSIAMYIWASLVPTIQEQQAWVKRMIYVLLLSLIGSMLAQ